MNATQRDHRLDWIQQALGQIARREYDVALPCLEHDDDLDAIATGIVMVGEELAAASAELEAAAARAIHNERLVTLGEITAGVVHELRQPMNNIRIVAQGLLLDMKRDRFETGTLKEKLESIVSMTSRMAKITDHMRTFTRRTYGRTFESIDIKSVVASALTLCRQQMKAIHVELVQDHCPEPLVVLGDTAGLEQVVLNLLSNARYAVLGSDRQDKQIEIATRKEDNYAVVGVADNGGGVPREICDSIFEPFYTTKGPEHGTGLGLSVSKRIVERHQGSLSVEMGDEGIARFEMRIPLHAAGRRQPDDR